MDHQFTSDSQQLLQCLASDSSTPNLIGGEVALLQALEIMRDPAAIIDLIKETTQDKSPASWLATSSRVQSKIVDMAAVAMKEKHLAYTEFFIHMSCCFNEGLLTDLNVRLATSLWTMPILNISNIPTEILDAFFKAIHHPDLGVFLAQEMSNSIFEADMPSKERLEIAESLVAQVELLKEAFVRKISELCTGQASAEKLAWIESFLDTACAIIENTSTYKLPAFEVPILNELIALFESVTQGIASGKFAAETQKIAKLNSSCLGLLISSLQLGKPRAGDSALDDILKLLMTSCFASSLVDASSSGIDDLDKLLDSAKDFTANYDSVSLLVRSNYLWSEPIKERLRAHTSDLQQYLSDNPGDIAAINRLGNLHQVWISFILAPQACEYLGQSSEEWYLLEADSSDMKWLMYSFKSQALLQTSMSPGMPAPSPELFQAQNSLKFLLLTQAYATLKTSPTRDTRLRFAPLILDFCFQPFAAQEGEKEVLRFMKAKVVQALIERAEKEDDLLEVLEPLCNWLVQSASSLQSDSLTKAYLKVVHRLGSLLQTPNLKKRIEQRLLSGLRCSLQQGRTMSLEGMLLAYSALQRCNGELAAELLELDHRMDSARVRQSENDGFMAKHFARLVLLPGHRAWESDEILKDWWKSLQDFNPCLVFNNMRLASFFFGSARFIALGVTGLITKVHSLNSVFVSDWHGAFIKRILHLLAGAEQLPAESLQNPTFWSLLETLLRTFILEVEKLVAGQTNSIADSECLGNFRKLIEKLLFGGMAAVPTSSLLMTSYLGILALSSVGLVQVREEALREKDLIILLRGATIQDQAQLLNNGQLCSQAQFRFILAIARAKVQKNPNPPRSSQSWQPFSGGSSMNFGMSSKPIRQPNQKAGSELLECLGPWISIWVKIKETMKASRTKDKSNHEQRRAGVGGLDVDAELQGELRTNEDLFMATFPAFQIKQLRQMAAERGPSFFADREFKSFILGLEDSYYYPSLNVPLYIVEALKARGQEGGRLSTASATNAFSLIKEADYYSFQEALRTVALENCDEVEVVKAFISEILN